MKAVVGFFGLNRSLQTTFDSINRNIFSVLTDGGYDVVRLGHFNCPSTINSPRSGEHSVKPVDKGLGLLNLELCWAEPQTEEAIANWFVEIKDFPWRGETDAGYNMRRNALWQLYSLRRLSQLVALVNAKADFYILLRPDLEYLDPLPLKEVATQINAGRDLITPDWATHCGLNDRFAICSNHGFKTYTTRFEKLFEFCRLRSYLHAEELLLYASLAAGLKLGAISMRARRVRSNGHVVAEVF